MRVFAHPSATAAAASSAPRASSASYRHESCARAHRVRTTSSHRASSAVFSGNRGARQGATLNRKPPGVAPRASSSDIRGPISDASSSNGTAVERESTDGDDTTTDKPSVTPSQAFKRLWTAADPWHVHAVSGGVFTVLGAGILSYWAKQDLYFLMNRGTEGITHLDTLTLWPLAVFSLAVAEVCAISGVPLGRLRGWRKTELSARSTLFQLVLTWQCLRLGPGGDLLAGIDSNVWAFSLSPFIWQTLTSLYILGFTKDDKRSSLLIAGGAWLFGAQVFPVAGVLQETGLQVLQQVRPQLITVWVHSLFGLVWLLNWSTFGASLRARRIIDDDDYRRWYLLRPSVFWIVLFALDTTAFAPWSSIGEYFTTLGGVGLIK